MKKSKMKEPKNSMNPTQFKKYMDGLEKKVFPFHKGQQVVNVKTKEVLGIVDEVKFGFFTVFREVSLQSEKPRILISRVRSALASVDENDVVHINKEALR